MEALRISEILDYTNGKLLRGNSKSTISSISLDSRKTKKNDLFIAIKGERYDGHNFLKEVFGRGAKGVVVNSKFKTTKSLRAIAKQSHEIATSSSSKSGLLAMTPKFKILIEVNNTRKALGDIAAGYRRKFKIPIIAITGSDGKTTTKELAADLLSSRFHLVKSPGNFNNEIGLPLTLFKLKKKVELAIVELGMNKPGEIKRLSEIAKPTIGVITNVGSAHQGFFKTRYGIARAKAELIEQLGKSPIILNRDTSYFSFLKKRAKGRVTTFGIKWKSDFQARDVVASSSGIEFRVNSLKINSCFLGCFNVYNALVAIALAKEFGISNQEIKRRLRNFKPLPHRFQIIKLKRFCLIDDTYNANPFAFRKAIEQLSRMRTEGRRVVIAGEMKELGDYSKKAHYSLGEFIAKSRVDLLVTVGKLAKEIGKGALQSGLGKENILYCQNNGEVLKSKKVFLPGDLILIKGSHTCHLEEVVEKMKKENL